MSRKDKLIKSKSIYTIRKKHQTLSDATIYENDHVTIIRNDGIFNTDMPLFSDSNFKFRIRSGGNGKKKHNRYGWISNESSDDNVFTLSNMPENNSITDESKIVQKPNYSSLRDFAYYGSAVELIKATVNDIIMRYPGGISYYSGLDAPEVWVEGRRYFLVSNEFNIDFWTPKGVSVDELESPMRVLGASYMNYEDKDGNDINLTICITGNCLDTIIGRVSFSNYYGDNNNSNNNLLDVRNSLQKSGVRHDDTLKEIENGNQIDVVGEKVNGVSADLTAQGTNNQYLYFSEDQQNIENNRLVVSSYTIDALTEMKTPIVNEAITFVVVGVKGEKCSKSAITNSEGIAYVYLSDNGWEGYGEINYTIPEILSTATCWFAFMEHNGDIHSGITQTLCTPLDGVLMANTNPIETKKWDEIDFYDTVGWGFCDNEITVHCFYDDATAAENIPISVSSITENGDVFITNGITDSNGDFSVHGNQNEWVHFGESHNSNIYMVNSFSACGFYNNDFTYGYLPNPGDGNCVINIMFKKKLEPIEFGCDAIDDCNYKWFDIYLDGEGNKKIVTDTNNHYDLGHNDLCIIRPKREFRNEFWDNLDDFEKVLLDRDTTPIYTARLETPYTIDNYYFYNLKTYTWPTVDGVTPDLTTSRFQGYLNSLISLAQYHDEFDSDNLWRMMTHESIKNLDWTFMRINDSDSSSDDEDNGLDSSRMRGTLNVYGRFFDDLKRYADNIKTSNNITYDEKNNLPDYFLTDAVEIGGFDAASVSSLSAISTDSASTIQNDDNFKKTLSTVNSNFMRRLAINETYIHSLKGTRNGLKSVLGLFGYKENSGETPTTTIGEFDIHEYIAIANNFPSYAETSRLRSLVDYVNYDENTNFMKGYPVAVVSPLGENSDEYDYYLIPWFNSNETYKHPFYFQQKGGWGKIMTKEINEPITIASSITENYGVSIYRETEPYMKFVPNIEDLKSISNNAVFKNMICYVTDITKMYEEYEDAPELYDDDERLDYSHYFVLKNISLSNYIGFVNTDLYYCYGWRNIRLREFTGATPTTRDGLMVLYLESIIENSKDNNPHFGKGEYDDGASYIEKFNLIFGDDLDDGVFDFLKDGDQEDLDDYDEISTLGFNVTNMVENNKKCYYFEDSQSQIQYRDSVTENAEIISVPIHTWTETTYTLIPIGDEDSYDYSDYEDFVNPENENDHVDEAAANSIINVKNLVINFGISNNIYAKKYIEKVVIPYLEHMIPSTTILRYKFDNHDNHDYVDLGLSVKWATCNIGANSPEEAGLYFSWGGTSGFAYEQVGNGEGKRAFTWDDYEFGPYSALTKYNTTDGKTVLEPEDDAATVNWGEGWRMPTKEEFEELMTLPHTWDSSRSGYSFTDANDNEVLFIFASGYADDGYVYNFGEYGYYWPSSLGDGTGMGAFEFYFGSDGYGIDYENRNIGYNVRPVHE